MKQHMPGPSSAQRDGASGLQKSLRGRAPSFAEAALSGASVALSKAFGRRASAQWASITKNNLEGSKLYYGLAPKGLEG